MGKRGGDEEESYEVEGEMKGKGYGGGDEYLRRRREGSKEKGRRSNMQYYWKDKRREMWDKTRGGD